MIACFFVVLLTLVLGSTSTAATETKGIPLIVPVGQVHSLDHGRVHVVATRSDGIKDGIIYEGDNPQYENKGRFSFDIYHGSEEIGKATFEF